MRSPIAQKILDDLSKEPWWYRLKIKMKTELFVLNCIGFKKYFTGKFKKNDTPKT